MTRALQSRETRDDTAWTDLGGAYGSEESMVNVVEHWNLLAGWERYRIEPDEEVEA